MKVVVDFLLKTSFEGALLFSNSDQSFEVENHSDFSEVSEHLLKPVDFDLILCALGLIFVVGR